METYLTIEELAVYLKLAEQTIRRWVLNHKIPYHKIGKVIRFRLSEIETWIDDGGIFVAMAGGEVIEGELFSETENAETAHGGEAVPDNENTETEAAV